MWPVVVVLGLIVALLVAFRVSPWPGALLVAWFLTEAATPKDARLPVVVRTHGGAWLSGDKIDDGTYFQRPANQASR